LALEEADFKRLGMLISSLPDYYADVVTSRLRGELIEVTAARWGVTGSAVSQAYTKAVSALKAVANGTA
jgi:hypothetical protein